MRSSRVPDQTAPKRPPLRRQQDLVPANSRVFRSPHADEASLFKNEETRPCHFCKATLRNPRLEPPLATTPIAIPRSSAGLELLGDKVLVCPTCAIERHRPTLAHFLANEYVHVLAWQGTSEMWHPIQIARWARILYGWAAKVDVRRKDDPAFQPIWPLREWPNLLLTSLSWDSLSIYPIWSAPQNQRGLIERFIKDARLPFPLPKPSPDAELNLGTFDPCEVAWLSQAWAQVVEKSPDLWNSLRGRLVLLPSHHLCYDPDLDVQRAIMDSLGQGCQERYQHMVSWAGWQDGTPAEENGQSA